MKAATVQHEMMHGLGWMHEQSNPGRKRYIRMSKDVIQFKDKSRGPSAFQMINPKAHAISPYPFEIGSIMMYGPRIYEFNCEPNKARPQVVLLDTGFT